MIEQLKQHPWLFQLDDSTLEKILKKIEIYELNIENVIKWFSNFLNEEEYNLALKLFFLIDFRNNQLSLNTIKFYITSIKQIMYQNILNNIILVSSDENTDSSNRFIYDIAKKWEIHESRVHRKKELNSSIINNKSNFFIFFNDTHGTGNQFVKDFKSTINTIGEDRCAITCLCITQIAIDRFKNEFPKIALLQPNFQSTKTIFQHQDNNKLTSSDIELIKKLGEKVYSKGVLGYKDSGLLIAYSHQCPNNTLPIIWANGNNNKVDGSAYPWNPLFEYKKIEDNSENKEKNIEKETVEKIVEVRDNTSEESGKKGILSGMKNKIALLYANPINLNYEEYIKFERIQKYYAKYNLEVNNLVLNLENLYNLYEYDSVFIFAKVEDNMLVIEDEYFISLKITSEKLDNILKMYKNINFSILGINKSQFLSGEYYDYQPFFENQNSIFNKYIHESQKYNFKKGNVKFSYQKTNLSNDFNILKDLKIFVGRENDIRNIIRDIIYNEGTSHILTILGSGGIGKTTLVKKIAQELANRGKFKDGFFFIDCEFLNDFLDFKKKVENVFNLNNAVDFEDAISSIAKKDRFILFDNFETLLHLDSEKDIKDIKELLFFLSGFCNIILTSRENINEDYEEVYSLNSLNLDDSELLYSSIMTKSLNQDEKRILRNEILDNLLNRNPLAIKLVAKLKLNVYDLAKKLNEDFFYADDTNVEDIEKVFSKESDLNIEKSKSLFYSISLSYERLEKKYKLMIELLSLFPDGIEKNNFIQFYNAPDNIFVTNKIGFKDINYLEDNTLVNVSDDVIKLQSIIGRFADYKFNKNNDNDKIEYYKRAYGYNHFVMMNVVNKVSSKKSFSFSSRLYDKYKNNFIKSLDYLMYIKEDDSTLEYVHVLAKHLALSTEYDKKIIDKLEILYDKANDKLYKEVIKIVNYHVSYFYGNFNYVFELLKKDYPYEKLFELTDSYSEKVIFSVAINIYTMEGYSSNIIDKNSVKLDSYTNIELFGAVGFFRKMEENYNKLNKNYNRLNFICYDYLINARLIDIKSLIKYKDSLHESQRLEYLQCVYLLFKYDDSKVSLTEINNLVVTNDFTFGLKMIMQIFKSGNKSQKFSFEKAITKMKHIKYYYVESILLYSKYLKLFSDIDSYDTWFEKGLSLSIEYKFRYLQHSFYSLRDNLDVVYNEDNYLVDEKKLE